MISQKKFYKVINLHNMLLVVGSLSIITSVNGCGDSLPETVGVHGKITWRGQPLTNAMVTFEPVRDSQGSPLRPSKGYTNNEGDYRLSTFRTNDGAMPGHYKVLIHTLDSAPAMEATGPVQPPLATIIPIRYSRADTSDLSATISEVGPSEMEINFDLVP